MAKNEKKEKHIYVTFVYNKINYQSKRAKYNEMKKNIYKGLNRFRVGLLHLKRWGIMVRMVRVGT